MVETRAVALQTNDCGSGRDREKVIEREMVYKQRGYIEISFDSFLEWKAVRPWLLEASSTRLKAS